VVDKEQLKEYSTYQLLFGLVLGFLAFNLVIGITMPEKRFVAIISAAFWAGFAVLLWYFRDDIFPNIRHTVEDARGDLQ
jgi:hypothetical protein